VVQVALISSTGVLLKKLTVAFLVVNKPWANIMVVEPTIMPNNIILFIRK
jgi:hypothetical protein